MAYRKLALFIVLGSMAALLYGCGGPKPQFIGLESKEPTSLPSKALWDYEFKGALQSIYFTPNSLLTTITASHLEGDLPVKSYFSPESGKVIWQGPIDQGLLIADTPYPVLLSIAEKQRPKLACYTYNGDEIRWQLKPEGNLLFTGSDTTLKLVFTLTSDLMFAKSESQQVVLSALSVETGKEQFSVVLGGVQNLLAPDDIIFCNKDVLYFFHGGIAAAISIHTGKILWKHKVDIPAEDQMLPINLWKASPEGALLVSGRHVLYMSGKKGIAWHNELPKGIFPRTISFEDQGSYVSYWLVNGAGVLRLDNNKGTIVWRNEQFVNDNNVWSPKGFVSTSDSLYYSVDKKLISINKTDGSDHYLQKLDISDNEYSDYKLLLKRGGRLVLLGARNVQSYKLKSGELDWGIIDFETPYATWDRYMANTSVFEVAVYSGVSQLQSGTPIGATPTGIPGVYKYEFRRANPNANLSVPVISRQRGIKNLLQSISVDLMGGKESNLNRVGISSAAKPGTGRSGMIPGRYSSFVNSLQQVVAVDFKANVAVVDLNTGDMATYPLLPSVQCSPYAVTDSAIKWIVEIYEPVGLFCNDRRIDFFKIKAPNIF